MDKRERLCVPCHCITHQCHTHDNIASPVPTDHCIPFPNAPADIRIRAARFRVTFVRKLGKVDKNNSPGGAVVARVCGGGYSPLG